MVTPLQEKISGDLANARKGNLSGIFPFLLIPVAAYNIVALIVGGGTRNGEPAMRAVVDGTAFSLPMLSSVVMRITWGELMIFLAIAFLFVEMIKSTSTASASIVNHMLSMVLFIVCLIEFLLLSGFATGTFLIMTLMVLLDALAGMVVTIVSARRDFGVEGMGS